LTAPRRNRSDSRSNHAESLKAALGDDVGIQIRARRNRIKTRVGRAESGRRLDVGWSARRTGVAIA
jgi:hypothetical protein